MAESLSESSDKSLVGRKLGDYQILRRLGRGGMADVYLAEQMSLGRKVAVKVLRTDLAPDGNYVRRFQNEARAVASLIHGNIVQIYEVGCVDGVHFLAQEYVAGQTLKQLVNRHGPLEVSRAVSIMRQIAAALNQAGQQRIIHRDIKPENILINPTGEVKVADFGLARIISGERTDMTQVGMTMGTPLYMSPEQVEGKSLDPRSDIYSFGVTAFFMLIGNPPFTGDSPLGIAVQHLQKEPPVLRELRPDLPEQLCDIVHKMLAKSPSNRQASAAQLLTDLRRLPIKGYVSSDDGHVDVGPDDNHDGQLDATMNLQAAMSATSVLARRRRRNRLLFPLLLLTGLSGGALLARLSWSGPILSVESLDEILPQASARDQYLFAITSVPTSEEAMKSVARFFPPERNSYNRYYSLLADLQLANFYLDANRLAESEALYTKLADLKTTDLDSAGDFAPMGLAGQAMILSQKDDLTGLRLKLIQVWPDLDKLDDETRSEVRRLARKLGIEFELDKDKEAAEERTGDP